MIVTLVKQFLQTMNLEGSKARIEIESPYPPSGRYECVFRLDDRIHLSLLLEASELAELIGLITPDAAYETIELPFKEEPSAESGRPAIPGPPDQHEVDLGALKEEFVERFFESARLLSKFDARITQGPMSVAEVMDRIVQFFWYEQADPFAEEYDPPRIRDLVTVLCNTRTRNRLIHLLDLIKARGKPLLITGDLLKGVLDAPSRS